MYTPYTFILYSRCSGPLNLEGKKKKRKKLEIIGSVHVYFVLRSEPTEEHEDEAQSEVLEYKDYPSAASPRTRPARQQRFK